MNKPYILGIAGGTGAGKTTLAHALAEHLNNRAALLTHDAYYRDLSRLKQKERAQTNFDHPDALETDLLVRHLDALKDGKPIDVPIYDFATHTRTHQTHHLDPHPVIILEGILIFSDAELRNRIDLKVFVDTDADARLIRRLLRDVQERGRTPESVTHQYLHTVRPMHNTFVEPTRKHADLIVPGENAPQIAITLLLGHLHTVLSAQKNGGKV